MYIRKRHHWVAICLGIIALLILAGGISLAIIRPWEASAPTASNQPPTPNPQPSQAEKQLACIENLPTQTKLGQKLMIAGYANTLASQQSAMTSAQLNGVLIMNETPAASITTFKQAFSITPTVAVDQEGGTVQRYTSEGMVPGATDITADYTPQQAYQLYNQDAKFLASVGLTTNFAPVLGVISAEPSPLPGRMYSSDPSTVTAYATQMIQASHDAGITPVVKHFPGLGSASGNTDDGSATTDPLGVLKTRDILPYQGVAPLQPDAMVSNAIVPDLTNGQPATWSSAAVELLRSYGYQNAVVYSDSLTAEAIPGTLAEAAVKAWLAGIDVALVVQDESETSSHAGYISEIINAGLAAFNNGTLSSDSINQSALRIFTRKGVDACTL